MRWPDGPGAAARSARPVVAVVAGSLLALAGIVSSVLAASPTPTAAPAGDPRSSGQGPGLVGDPVVALVAVAAIAALAVVVTLLYVRATGPAARRRGS